MLDSFIRVKLDEFATSKSTWKKCHSHDIKDDAIITSTSLDPIIIPKLCHETFILTLFVFFVTAKYH